MTFEKLWSEEINNYFNTGNEVEVIPGYFNDIVESIKNNKDLKIDNFEVYNPSCGGMTYILFHKHQIGYILKNYRKKTYSIDVTNSNKIEKLIKKISLKNHSEINVKTETKLAKELLFYIVKNLLGISDEMIKSFQEEMPVQCLLGYYVFPNGHLEIV